MPQRPIAVLLAALATLCLALLSVTACGDDADIPGNDEINDSVPVSAATVEVTADGFDPSTVTVDAGDAVTFTNSADEARRVVADDDTFDTGALEPGESTVVVFTEAGTVAFHENDATAQKGEVTVEAVSTP